MTGREIPKAHTGSERPCKSALFGESVVTQGSLNARGRALLTRATVV